VVVVDDLGDVGQLTVGRLEQRVVETRPTVEQQDGWTLAHLWTIRDQARALNIEYRLEPFTMTRMLRP
jgi:hypothetical protein